MTRAGAYKKYKRAIDKETLFGYKDAEEYIIVNDDEYLTPIKIPLPSPPDWKYIEGFGLPAKEQKWKRPVMPAKLVNLTKKKIAGIPLTIEEIWEYLEKHYDDYEEEIEWIKTQWYYRLHGYWFFNNGTPTYITGKNWYYISYYQIDIGYPKYRSRDRKYWLFVKFCHNDTTTFAKRHMDGENKNVAIPEEDGSYKMIDLGRRVCFGDCYPKMRREGATYKAQANNCETITRKIEATGGIQSRTEKDAKKVFQKKLIRPYKRIPFFFRPITASSTSPKNIIEFDVPSTKQKGAIVDVGLQSSIDFEVGDEGAYDGEKLFFHHDDEVGKNKNNDVWQRHLVSKECLSQQFGLDIHGYTSKTSTAGEMSEGGGENFLKMCLSSDYYKRNDSGQTLSGMYLLFIKSEDGLIVDEYGNSVIEDPTEPIRGENGHMIRKGARSVIEDQREGFLLQGDISGWQEKVRQYPQNLMECFITKNNSVGFNIKILETRYAQIRLDKSIYIQGDFEFTRPGDFTSPVEFRENPEGRFRVSYLFPHAGMANKRFMKNDTWFPGNATKVYVGADPFKFSKTEGEDMSDGGIAAKLSRDLSIDGTEKDISEWETDRTCLTYRYRPATVKEYVIDVLKVCLYYGCTVFSETNVNAVNEYFTEWGYAGFLNYGKDAHGNFRKTPGMHSGEASKQELFNVMRDHIELRGMYERHADLIKEEKEIPSIQKMTKYDLLTARGLAELGEQTGWTDYMSQVTDQSNGTDIGGIFQMRH